MMQQRITRLSRVLILGAAALLALAMSSQAMGRNIFLNGIDISSARGQLLEGVNIRIDPEGNVFIEAPQYQVNEENTFLPLSSWNTPTAGTPAHRPHGPVSDEMGHNREAKMLPKVENPVRDGKAAGKAPIDKARDVPANAAPLQEKEGDKTGN